MIEENQNPQKNIELVLKGVDETRLFAMKLAETLCPGSVIGLIGELGAGKTTFSKAIGEGLGLDPASIVSPTFTIIKEYKGGRLPFYHFDLYRIGDSEELYDLGLDEYFYGEGVSVVEWADPASGILPPETIFIELKYGASEDERLCRVSKCTY